MPGAIPISSGCLFAELLEFHILRDLEQHTEAALVQLQQQRKRQVQHQRFVFSMTKATVAKLYMHKKFVYHLYATHDSDLQSSTHTLGSREGRP